MRRTLCTGTVGQKKKGSMMWNKKGAKSAARPPKKRAGGLKDCLCSPGGRGRRVKDQKF